MRDVARAYRVSSVSHPGAAGADIDHSSVLYLVGPDGRLITPIRATQTGADIARTIARYVS